MEKIKWSVQEFWNEQIIDEYHRPAKVRDYIAASDIGRSFWDRFQKMNGIEHTNPFDERTLRVFSAGREFESMIKDVFKTLGIYINSQDDDRDGKHQFSVIPATEKRLKVIGKYDVKVGGKVDIEQVKEQIRVKEYSQQKASAVLKLAYSIQERYPSGLPPLMYEIKSINSLAFWHKKGFLTEAYPHHELQCFTYLQAEQLDSTELIGDKSDEGRVLYVSKDDLMMAEFPVFPNEAKIKEVWEKDVEQMSYYILNNEEPPKPDNIVYNPKKKMNFQMDKKKYTYVGAYDWNWEVERSNYLTLLTGCKDKEEWKKKFNGDFLDKNAELREQRKDQEKAKLNK